MCVEMAAKVLIKISIVTRRLNRHLSRGYFRRRDGLRARKRGDECDNIPMLNSSLADLTGGNQRLNWYKHWRVYQLNRSKR